MRSEEWGEHGQFEHLLASQQRQLRKLIEDQIHLDEDDFLLTMSDGGWAGFIGGYTDVPVIIYEPEPFFFSLTYFHATFDALEDIPAGHAIYFKPGDQIPEKRYMRLDWQEACNHFASWLGYIARELGFEDEPDEHEEDEAVEDFDEPESIPATPVAVASAPAPEGPPPTSRQPSWFQRANDWIKAQKEKHGVIWVVIAFVIGLIVTIIAALL